MKRIIIVSGFFALFGLQACELGDCQPGERNVCECANGSKHAIICNDDWEWSQCPCEYGATSSGYDGSYWSPSANQGPTGGSDSNYASGAPEPETDWSTYDLLDYFPECDRDSYVNDCHGDEVRIPCTDLCWRICPPEQYWDGESCVDSGENGFTILAYAAAMCADLDADYRLPTLEEVARLTNSCNPRDFVYSQTNRCGAYHESAMRFVMDLADPLWTDAWVGELEWCNDSYGQKIKQCAWTVRFYGEVWGPTLFDFLYSHGQPGSTLSGAFCVRETS